MTTAPALTRPAFDASGLPDSVKPRAITKANGSWCYVAQDRVSSFYVAEDKARAMHEAFGGYLFPPIAN